MPLNLLNILIFTFVDNFSKCECYVDLNVNISISLSTSYMLMTSKKSKCLLSIEQIEIFKWMRKRKKMERNKGVEFLHYCNVLIVAQIICLESCLWHRLSVMSKKEWQCRLVYLIYSEKKLIYPRVKITYWFVFTCISITLSQAREGDGNLIKIYLRGMYPVYFGIIPLGEYNRLFTGWPSGTLNKFKERINSVTKFCNLSKKAEIHIRTYWGKKKQN